MLIRSTFDSSHPIYLYNLGSIRIKINSFESKKLSKCFIFVNEPKIEGMISYNLSALIQSKEELEEIRQAKIEQSINLGVFALLIAPPTILILYLSCKREEWLEEEPTINSREGTTAFETLSEERKQRSLDETIGEESIDKQEAEALQRHQTRSD